MSGLPVSHVGEKVSGGVISTGSPTVHVGSSAVGLADRVSACVPLVGKPVNPMLGSKLLPEEVDFAWRRRTPSPSPVATCRATPVSAGSAGAGGCRARACT